MIEVKGLCKRFDDFDALNNLDLKIETGSIYGLIGINGSGKTTLIKHLTGILKADQGSIQFDGVDAYDNPEVKQRIGYIPDELFFFGGYNLKAESKFYKGIYPNWNQDRYLQMIEDFGLGELRRISKFSKGMQKQAAFILTMSCMPEYLILDEPVDGLDPIIRRLVWRYILDDVADRQMTVLISSHNLRELEGLVDTIGVMYKGSVKFVHKDLDELEAKGGLSSLEDLFFSEMEGGKL